MKREDDLEDEILVKDKTILVIENDHGYQSKLVRLLESYGYKVETANTGFEGIRKYERINPDIVIMNIDLPVMDGISTLSMLRRYNPSCKAILSAPYPMKENALGIGPYRVFNRNDSPFRLGELVDELLEKKQKKYSGYLV